MIEDRLNLYSGPPEIQEMVKYITYAILYADAKAIPQGKFQGKKGRVPKAIRDFITLRNAKHQ